jgi:hypothetical protein
MSKVLVGDGCWNWTGTLNWAGYGHLRIGGRKGHWRGAHRIAYEFYRGEVPAGAFVCHSCDNPGCVNPSHLFVGTPLDNTRDMLAKGRGRNPIYLRNSAKTHCMRGHEFTPENTYRNGSARQCRQCNSRKAAAYRARQREKAS